MLQLLLFLNEAAYLSWLSVECLQINFLLILYNLLEFGLECLVSFWHARQTERVEINEALVFLIYYNLESIDILFE